MNTYFLSEVIALVPVFFMLFTPFLYFLLLQGNSGLIDARQETRPDAPVENQVLSVCLHMHTLDMYVQCICMLPLCTTQFVYPLLAE